MGTSTGRVYPCKLAGRASLEKDQISWRKHEYQIWSLGAGYSRPARNCSRYIQRSVAHSSFVPTTVTTDEQEASCVPAHGVSLY